MSQHLFLWQTYIKSMDKDFVAATIQAIGRCATNIGEVRDTCLNGLVQLLSNRDGESLWMFSFILFLCAGSFRWISHSYVTASSRSRLGNPGLLQQLELLAVIGSFFTFPSCGFT